MDNSIHTFLRPVFMLVLACVLQEEAADGQNVFFNNHKAQLASFLRYDSNIKIKHF